MTWYTPGTVTVINGSPTITGASTLWVDVGTLNPGDMFNAPDGKFYQILTINSNTGLTLATNYLGSSLSGQAYSIIPIGLLPSTLAQLVKSTLATANTALASTVRYDINSMGLTLTQQQNARTNIAALSALDVGQGRLSKSVAGGVDVTLSAAEASNQFIELTGTITANINVIVPAAARLFYIANLTSGAFTVTIKTPGGTGVPVTQSGRTMLECDAINVVNPLSYIKTSGVTEDGLGNVCLGGVPSIWNTSYFKAIDIAGGGALFAYSPVFQVGLSSNANYPVSGYVYKATGFASDYVQYQGMHIWNSAPSGAAGNPITFVQVMKVDAAGALSAGSSTSLSSHSFASNSTSASQSCTILNYASSGTPVALDLYVGTTGSASSKFLLCGDAGADRLYILGNGNVQNQNNSYGAFSDLKLKENITDSTQKLEKLMRVRIVSYNLKSDPEHKQLGVIAQELEQVFPGLVEETPDFIDVAKTREVPPVLDDEGNEVKPAFTEEYTEREATGTVTKSVKYSVFVPMLVKAMQEQQALIESQTSRIAALEAATPH